MKRRIRLAPKGSFRNLLLVPSPVPSNQEMVRILSPDSRTEDVYVPSLATTPSSGPVAALVNHKFTDVDRENRTAVLKSEKLVGRSSDHHHNSPQPQCFLPTLMTPPRRKTLSMRKTDNEGLCLSSGLRCMREQQTRRANLMLEGILLLSSDRRTPTLTPPVMERLTPPQLRPRILDLEFDTERVGNNILVPQLLTPPEK